MKETLLKKSTIYKGRVIDVRNDRVQLPNKKTAYREFIVHPGAVAVLPFIDKKRIILLRQYRYPIGEVTWEIPAGKIDASETPLCCIKRELGEETGFQASRYKQLMSYWPSAAFSTEIIYIYVAHGLRPLKAPHPDEDEFLETKFVKLTTCFQWIKTGKIKDSKTILALLGWANISNRSLG